MIARITGILEAVESNFALLRPEHSGLTYQVLVSAYSASRLGDAIGQSLTLHTLAFIESQNQGATMTPRLAGFVSDEDRRFYELFTTCKGVGNKRALRAMALSTPQIAAAIVDRDAATLQSLPEIGKRMAETIIVTLSGKVDAFLAGSESTAGAASGSDVAATGEAQSSPTRNLSRQALEVLLQLGENRTAALVWIDQALRQEERPENVEALIASVYQIKASS